MLTGTVAPQVATMALAIGLLFSLLCYLITNLSPGGMITPGWIALSLFEDPRKVAMIIVLTALTYFGTRLVQRYVILYGKRLFAAVMMVGITLSAGTFLAVTFGDPQLYTSQQTVGFIIPGLIAYQLVRQPTKPTLISTGVAGLASYGVLVTGVLLGFVAIA
jgi:poly-gamma-glutamate biosynthesis protein PgsC/CapC